MHLTNETASQGTKRSSRPRIVGDIWDALALLLVLLLVVQLWPEADTPSQIRELSGAVNGTSSSRAAAATADSGSMFARSGNSAWERHQPANATSVDPGVRTTGENRSAESVLEGLMEFQQRPDWELLELDMAAARNDLAWLVEQGDSAVPAIRSYLRNLRALSAKGPAEKAMESIGYGSLRLALFDVLKRIGGNQAEAIWYDELRATESPAEIEVLGRYLDERQPGLYRDEVLTVARQAFSLALEDGVHGQDTGPLFEVFKAYGDSALVPELEQMSKLRWGQYAAVTLAGLPNGAGMSSLARWVEGASPRNVSAAFALRILAQNAEYPEAQEALINSVRSGQITEAYWPEFAKLLAGTYRIQLEPPPAQNNFSLRLGDESIQARLLRSRTYISRTPGGGQVLYGLETAAPALMPDQAESRLKLIETLHEQTQSPAARRELERAFDKLWIFYQEQMHY